MDSFSCSSFDSLSLSSDSRVTHDVFINFSPEDTSKTFVSNLDVALAKAGIETYINYHLHQGTTDLGPELLEAIEEAHISIIVFSQNYTESSSCLHELQKIMECRRTHAKLAVPVFYDVDPSVVRDQQGAFGQVLRDTATKLYFGSGEEEKMENLLLGWRTALTQAADFSGWNAIYYRNEAELVQQIVQTLLRKLNRVPFFIAAFPVGLDTRVQQVIQFIENQSSKVCLIGICGMGGSGKTTTAKAIYDRLHGKFLNTSFIENAREVFEKENSGIIHLQQQLLSDILNINVTIHSNAEGEMMIGERFQGKTVLVVLDDVIPSEQLEALCANRNLFGPGSVLIVTTRYVHLLKLSKFDYVFTMKVMDENESLELFSWHAFKQPCPVKDFNELSMTVVAYCEGLPLALEVLGSHLFSRTKQEWKSVLSKLERISNDRVQEKLRISYDGLKDDMVKNIFLDICCFFIGMDREDATQILNACGFDADIGIDILIERSLVKIEKNNKLGMHNLIRDMGREIVRKSSAKQPGKRSRLWSHKDVLDILTKNSGTENVEGLILNPQRTDRVCFTTDAFKKMTNLRLLQLDHVDLTGDYGYLSKQLRYINWQGFPNKSLPSPFLLEKLVVLKLKHSNIKQVWNETMVLVNLKILNLSHSRYLKSSPDFSKVPNLEKLIMKDCPCLSEIHPSIGDLKNILLLNLKDCTGLSNLPKKIYQLKSLKTLILSGCLKIDKLEEDIEQMESLTTLIAKNTAIKEVPFSVVRSKSINYISLGGYEGFSRDVFPSLIWSWMPQMNPRISPFGNITYGLASIDVQKNNLGFLSPMVTRLLRMRIIGAQFRSKIQLTQELRRIVDDQYDVNFTKVETLHASQISNLSLRSLLIGMGSFHIVIGTLTKRISQGLPTNGSGEFFLPGDNYPSWLAYSGEGPSVHFQVPEDSDRCMKGITFCVVYSSTSENMATEYLASVLIINYTKLNVHVYKRDTIMSFNDEDWKNVTSNLGPGDNVEISVVFGHGLIVKETAVYLIYDQSITTEVDADEKDVLKNDVDAKSKGGPLRCNNQRDTDEASKRHEKILNQSGDADEKGALVNDVDANRRMVELIPYAVAESLFNRLASTTFLEHGRIYGVMDELEMLKDNVESIRVVLPDAQKKQEQDFAVQNWITSLKDVLHLADDLLDEFIIEGMRYKVDAGDKNQVTWVHSSTSSHNFLHQKMAPEIEKIQKKFDDVLEEMDKLKLQKAVVVKQTDSLRSKSISFLLESDITGREEDKKVIINLLRQPRGNISSIVIGGIRGIGKTTFAQFVYNDVEVQNHFEKRMWVCVSNHFDVKTIVKKMLESLIESKIDTKLSFEYIQHKLRENLTGERYLLVLDDICNDSHVNWTQLRTYLMCGSKDSKVLMTTRCKIVSKIPEAGNPPYVLNGLTLDVSWSMLKKIIFGKETCGVNQKLESIGKKIADKCNGVPLAIRTMGGLLQSKSEEREWTNVLQGGFWKLYDDKENIMSILKLSYQNLSLRLKQCFAYCSLYPKGWEIKKDLLIQLWMAQGYLDCADEKTLMEDVGNEFVKIFLMKSFFQDAKVGEDGDIVSFKMHDLMHDLATQVAGNDCCYLDIRETKIRVQRPVHVSLEPSAVHLLDSLDASRLRTLILLSSNEGEELNGDELSVLSKFKHLRVLKLSYCSLSKLSSSIGELNHLRYLSLSHCRGLGSLYESINSLVLLQTLILTPLEKFELSAEVVSKLINLRHLHISNWKASREETPSEFVKLSNLKYEGMIFSNWLSPLTNIVEISFFLCGNLQYLPPLEHLPFLKSLHISFLEELEYMCYEQDFTSAFFPSLESLSMQFCDKFRGWWRMGDDFNNSNSSQKLSLPPFPRLSQLSIIGCQMLTCMPAFPNLENRLELYNSCVETLVATLNTVALESLNHSPPLSRLKSLHIDGVSLDVKRIPKDWMQNLTSLQLLQISWFSCQAFQEIKTWFKDDHKRLPSLQTIAFHNCEDLEALPDWICSLPSLQHLRVHDCINLTSLPEGMPCLTLEIIGCPFLDEECSTNR